MSPEEDLKYSYLKIDAYYIGQIFFGISTCLTLIGLYFSALPHYVPDLYFSNQTKYVMQNYKVFENGSKYYELPDESGNLTVYYLSEWFDRLLVGDYRYNYGNSFWNYCVDRIVPGTESMSSIFRSMNHLVIVQVCFRTAVLFTLTFSLFQCLLLSWLSKTWLEKNPMNKFFGFPLVLIDIIHNVCLFFISSFQNDQDSHLMEISRISIIILTMTTVFQLLFNAFLQSNHRWQVLGILLSSLTFLSHNTVLADFDAFLEERFCDSMAPDEVVRAQLIYFLSFFVCGYLRNQSLRGIHIITCSTQEEIDYEISYT